MPYKNRADRLAYMKRYYHLNKDRIKIRDKLLRDKDPIAFGAARRARYLSLRLRAIKHLGNECVTCGFSDPRVLEFDHIQNDGSTDRRIRPMRTLLRDILRGTELNIQILCSNCNSIKRFEYDQLRFSK